MVEVMPSVCSSFAQAKYMVFLQIYNINNVARRANCVQSFQGTKLCLIPNSSVLRWCKSFGLSLGLLAVH